MHKKIRIAPSDAELFCLIFKRESEMEAEQSEGLHFRTSAETTGSTNLYFQARE